jgi:hypothetical protein
MGRCPSRRNFAQLRERIFVAAEDRREPLPGEATFRAHSSGEAAALRGGGDAPPELPFDVLGSVRVEASCRMKASSPQLITMAKSLNGRVGTLTLDVISW